MISLALCQYKSTTKPCNFSLKLNTLAQKIWCTRANPRPFRKIKRQVPTICLRYLCMRILKQAIVFCYVVNLIQKVLLWKKFFFITFANLQNMSPIQLAFCIGIIPDFNGHFILFISMVFYDVLCNNTMSFCPLRIGMSHCKLPPKWETAPVSNTLFQNTSKCLTIPGISCLDLRNNFFININLALHFRLSP